MDDSETSSIISSMISEAISKQCAFDPQPLTMINNNNNNNNNNDPEPLMNNTHQSTDENVEHPHDHDNDHIDVNKNVIDQHDDQHESIPSATIKQLTIIRKQTNINIETQSKPFESIVRNNQSVLDRGNKVADRLSDSQNDAIVECIDSIKLKLSPGKPTTEPGNNDSICSTSTGEPPKRKKYNELLLEGFAITAFETWEDLQEEAKEQDAAKAKKDIALEDSTKKLKTSSSGTSQNKLLTTDSSTKSKSKQKSTASPRLPKPKQASTSKASSKSITSSNGSPESKKSRKKASSDKQQPKEINQSQNGQAQIGVKHDTGNGDITIQRNHDKLSNQTRPGENQTHQQMPNQFQNHHQPHHQDDKQAARDALLHETSQQIGEFFNQASYKNSKPIANGHPSLSAGHQQQQQQHQQQHQHQQQQQQQQQNMHHMQSSQSRLVDSSDPMRPTNRPTYEPSTQAPNSGHPSTFNHNYPMRVQPNHPGSAPPHAVQHYPQQHTYRHMYPSQMHNTHQPSQYPPIPPTHQQPPTMHPYMNYMNHYQQPGSYSHPPNPQVRGPPPPPATLPLQPHRIPLAAPPPVPGSSSMTTQSPYVNPYSMIETANIRQTSVNPTQSYGHHPYQQPPPQPLQHSSNSYMQSPTERSFMEYTRSYANANYMTSSSYANVPGLYGANYDRGMASGQYPRANSMNSQVGPGNPYPSYGTSNANAGPPPPPMYSNLLPYKPNYSQWPTPPHPSPQQSPYRPSLYPLGRSIP